MALLKLCSNELIEFITLGDATVFYFRLDDLNGPIFQEQINFNLPN